MIKIYGMKSCPDCSFVDEQVKGNGRYEVIDIGEHVRNLKAFLHCETIIRCSTTLKNMVMQAFRASS